MSKQVNVKKFYSLLTEFSVNKDNEGSIVLQMNECGIKAHWLEESNKRLLENKLCDPTNPLNYDDLQKAVYVARGEEVLRIMLTDVKALSDADKEIRRANQQAVPAYLKSIKKQLNDLQNPKDAAARKVKTDSEFILELVDKGEARITKSENPDFKVKEVMDLLAALRAVLQKQ
jgi:hypothetical protein